jgi:ribose/xylose/arabinose/galactoside ABC-type transport system permease subunit
VDVSKWRYIVYVVGATSPAVAGLFLASLMKASLPQAGTGYELNVIAAVILGGTSMNGGVGNLLGTLLGVVIMGTLDNGFTLLNVPAFYQMIAKGSVLILAVFIDQVRTGGYE